MRRVVLAFAMTVGLAIGTVVPASALDTSVTLNCSDGTSVKLVVDADTLTALTQAVQAMIDYPAGLSCTLVQNPLGVSFGSIALADSPGKNPFIVGGGRWQVPCADLGTVPSPGIDPGLVARVPGAWYSLRPTLVSGPDDFIWVNIAVNVHQKDSTFFGSLNETIPANQFCSSLVTTPDNPTGQAGESHFSTEGPGQDICMTAPMGTTVNTVKFVTTFVTAKVTKTSGQVPFPFVNVNDYVHFGFSDTGNPGQQPTDPTTMLVVHDMLNGPPVTPSTNTNPTCSGPVPIFNLGSNDGTNKQYGNISIRTAP